MSELSSARGQARLAFTAGGESLNPLLHATPADQVSTERLRRFTGEAERIAAAGAAAFGEIALEHFSSGRAQHPYESSPPDHPLLLALADLAARYGMPIEIHMEAVPQDMAFSSRPAEVGEPGSAQRQHPALRAAAGAQSIRPFRLGPCRLGPRRHAHAGLDAGAAESPCQSLHEHQGRRVGRTRHGAALGKRRPATGMAAMVRAFPERFMVGSDQFAGDGVERLELMRRIVDSLPADSRR